MYTGQIDTITNKEDWTGPFVQLIDNSDGSIINILNVGVGFNCSIYVKYLDGCQVILGSIASGEVIVSAGDDGPGFQWAFKASRLSGLCPGTYEFGVKTTANSEVKDLIVGTLAVVGGN